MLHLVRTADNYEYTAPQSMIDVLPNICGIYTRQSTPHQNSLNDQLEACCKEALSRGYQLGVVFSDRSSAWKSVPRQFTNMINLIPIIKIKDLFIFDSSRYARNVGVAYESLKTITANSVNITSIIEKQTWTPHPLDQENLLKKILDAQTYSTILSIRMREKFKLLKAKGVSTGTPAYGYTAYKDSSGIRRFKQNKEEQKIIKLVNRLYKTKKTNDIVTHLNKNKINKNGKLWTASSVRRLKKKRDDLIDGFEDLNINN